VILSAIIAKAIPWLIGLVGLLGVYWRGKHNGRADAHLENLQRYHKTRERMDDVKVGNDPAVLREWMRERGKQ